jgi:hypothetical protein
MAFPTTIVTYTTKQDNVDYPEAAHINDLQTVVEALETKVGVDGSVVATSLDYKLKNTTSGHDHDGSDSKKVVATNLDPTGITVSQLLRANAAGTAVEGSGYTIASLLTAMTSASQLMWPVGSIFLGAVATSPATLLGFGTWVRISEAQMLVGFKTGDADFGVLKATGGSKTSTALLAHTHTGPSHTHTGSGTSSDISANHTHGVSMNTGGESGHTHGPAMGESFAYYAAGGLYADVNGGADNRLGWSTNTGGSTGHVHSISGNTGTVSSGHTHTYSFTSSSAGTGATSSAGSGASFSIINPFCVVYTWERTS